MMQREKKKKRGREVSEDKPIQVNSEKCAKKVHHKNTHPHHEFNEVVELSVFDFPWIKDGMMLSSISEEDWYLEGTFLFSLRAAIEDQGEIFSQFSSSVIASAGGSLELLPEIDNGVGDACSIPNVENAAENLDIWASVLNQPLGRH